MLDEKIGKFIKNQSGEMCEDGDDYVCIGENALLRLTYVKSVI